MAGTKTEYPALLAALQPMQAVTILNSRVKQIHKINEDISDWLAERRKVEEAYAAGLNRLAIQRSDLGVELGVFQQPWQSIIAGTAGLAEAHSAFAQRIKSDVEASLRDQKRDLQSMSSLQSNLSSMAKEVEKSQRKSGSHGGTSSEWESQAPYVFEQLQTLDENRVNQMREALTQLQTHEIDCHERSKTSAESGLNALLNVDTPEEVSAFVARTSSEIPVPPPPESTRPETSGRTRAGTSRSDRNMTGSSVLAPPGQRRDTDDQRSELSDQAEPTEKTEKKSRLSGLRRLGTVMTRRKDKEKLDEKPPKKSRNPLRRGSSTNQAQLPSASNSATDLPYNLTRRTSAQDERPAVLEEPPAATNGPAEPSPALLSTEASRDVPSTNGQAAPVSIPQIGVRPPSTIVEEGTASAALADIERAQQEANAQGESDNAFNLNIRDKPIQEESTDQQQAAMANVSSTLRASVVPPPARRSNTLRGRRDVRNTMFVPNPTPENFPIPESAPAAASISPTVPSVVSPIVPSEHRSADTQSIRSAHSLASSVGPGAVKHADMLGPGLNASIVETSGATFSNGKVTKAIVIGEIAMVHNGDITGSTTPHLRLENFAVLEKVAPNPTFVSQIPNKSGEYNLDLAQLSRTSVAFKYQVHLSEWKLSSYAPLQITPAHRIAANQTDVILNYSLNPAFATPVGSKAPIVLNNVVIMLTLEGAKATSCQLKPADGTFNKDRGVIYWRLGDLTLDSASTGGKLLARFTTESEAKGSSIEARWEVKGAGSGLGLSLLGEGGSGSGTGTSSDPFADAGASSTSLAAAKEVEVTRKMISGRYIAS